MVSMVVLSPPAALASTPAALLLVIAPSSTISSPTQRLPKLVVPFSQFSVIGGGWEQVMAVMSTPTVVVSVQVPSVAVSASMSKADPWSVAACDVGVS